MDENFNDQQMSPSYIDSIPFSKDKVKINSPENSDIKLTHDEEFNNLTANITANDLNEAKSITTDREEKIQQKRSFSFYFRRSTKNK